MAINNINNLANSRLQNSGTSQGVATKSATSAESNRAATVKTECSWTKNRNFLHCMSAWAM